MEEVNSKSTGFTIALKPVTGKGKEALQMTGQKHLRAPEVFLGGSS